MLDSGSHKVVVIGAGHVGATFSFALMKSGIAPKINDVCLSIPVVLKGIIGQIDL